MDVPFSLPAVLAALQRLEEQRCACAGELFAPWPLAYPISIGTITTSAAAVNKYRCGMTFIISAS